jgi:hypothetical protein
MRTAMNSFFMKSEERERDNMIINPKLTTTRVPSNVEDNGQIDKVLSYATRRRRSKSGSTLLLPSFSKEDMTDRKEAGALIKKQQQAINFRSLMT